MRTEMRSTKPGVNARLFGHSASIRMGSEFRVHLGVAHVGSPRCRELHIVPAMHRRQSTRRTRRSGIAGPLEELRYTAPARSVRPAKGETLSLDIVRPLPDAWVSRSDGARR